MEKLFAVRIQDGPRGMSAEPGGLRLAYGRDSERNTLHFALNAAVADHAYGSFNHGPDGEFKGSVAIVAPLEGMPDPAGFGQVDTWFRMSSEREPGGGARRWLDLGPEAVAFAPSGMAMPEGVEAIFYEGGVEGRDAAIAKHLAERGAAMRCCAMRSWVGESESDAFRWGQAECERIYGERSARIRAGTHDGSADEALESMSVKGLLASLREGPLMQGPGGEDVEIAPAIRARAAAWEEQIEAFLAALPQAERERVQAHCQAQAERLREGVREAGELELGWAREARGRWARDLGAKAEALPGAGPFHLAAPGAKEGSWEALGGAELAERAIAGGIPAGAMVWRSGMAAWEAAQGSALGRLFAREGCALPGTAPPALAAPPSLSAAPAPEFDLGKLAARRARSSSEAPKPAPAAAKI